MALPLERAFSQLINPGANRQRLTHQDCLALSAHAMDNIMEVARHFRADNTYLDSPMATLQRPQGFGCDLMDFVDPAMSLRNYIGKASAVFAVWRQELDKENADRSVFPESMKRGVFAGYEAGWHAYSAHMQKQLPWFSCPSA